MSHNTIIKDIAIKNLSVLERAIKELAAEGVAISLTAQPGTFRTYPGQDNKADAVIHLPRERYDIGLQKQKDGTYLPILDASMMHQNASVSCSVDPGSYRDYDRAAIGKLMQRYTVCEVEREAALQGHSFRRQKNKNGDFQVVCEVR